MNRPSSFLLAALAALVALPGCVNRAAQAQAKRTEAITGDPTRPVVVAAPETKDLQETLEISGQLNTAADTQVGAKISGRLVAVYVQDGSSVSAGQVIAQQDTATLDAQLASAQAQVANARAQLAAQRAALAQQIRNAAVSPRRTESALGQARSQLRSAQANLKKVLAGARPQERLQVQASLNSAKTNLDVAKKELERVQTLVQAGALAGNRLEQQQNVVAQAESQYRNALEAVKLIQAGNRPEDVAAAREAVRQAEEGVATAKANLSLDASLQDQVAAARAQVAATEASIQSAEAQVRIAQAAIADARIVAPFAGKISGAPAQVGQVVGPGTAVARLVGAEGVYFEGDVPETEFARVKIGQTVSVKVGANDAPISGRIVAIRPRGEGVGRVFTARVALDGAPPETLAAGLFARGAVVLRTVPGATVVPSTAVVEKEGKNYVYTVQGDKAKAVPVTAGLRQGDLVQVDGVPPGAKIVTKGQEGLSDGAAVKIQEPETRTAAAPPQGAN